MDVFVGVDIGGSHIGVGIVDKKGRVLLSQEVAVDNATLTPDYAVEIIAQKAYNMTSQLPNARIVCVGVGCPGQACNGTLVVASNLPHFKHVPLAKLLSEALNNVSVTLVNDADAAISAEVWGTYGAYKDYKNIAMVTLGTGIGFGLILDGRLYQGSYGLIEGGHMIVSTSSTSRPCGCGQTGCVEAYSSAKNTALRLRELDAKDGNTIEAASNGKEVFSRFALNDYNAVNVVEETAEHLAVMCINICRIVDPEVIIFGGGLSKAGSVLIDLIRKHMAQKTWTVLPTDVKLVVSQSEHAGMVGAALAAQNKFQKHQANNFATNERANFDHSLKETGMRWTGPFITTASIVVLAISIHQERFQHRREYSWVRNILLVGQIGIGIALTAMKN